MDAGLALKTHGSFVKGLTPDAGLALRTHGSFVKGLTPLRVGVAGFDFNFKLSCQSWTTGMATCAPSGEDVASTGI